MWMWGMCCTWTWFWRFPLIQVAASTSLAEEVLGNLGTVKSFAMEEEEVARYKSSLDTAASAYSRLGLGIGVFTAASALATNG